MRQVPHYRLSLSRFGIGFRRGMVRVTAGTRLYYIGAFGWTLTLTVPGGPRS